MKNIRCKSIALVLICLFAACDKPKDDGDDPTDPLSASFQIGNTGVFTAGCRAVEFVNTSENADSYQWNFGDGTQSTEAAPRHVYANAGTYTVVLTARQGATSQTATATVSVTAVSTFSNFYAENYGGNKLVETSDGGYLVVRNRLVGSYTDILLAKFSATGVLLWTRVLGGPNSEQALDAIAATDGGFILVGNYYNPTGNAQIDAVIWRLDASGNELWRQQFGGDFIQQFNAVVQFSDGGIWAGGYNQYLGSPNVGFIAQLDAAGNILAYGDTGTGNGEFVITQMEVAADGNVVICGKGDADPGPATDSKIYVTKRGRNGGFLWTGTAYGFSTTEQPTQLLRTSDQGFVLVSNYQVAGSVYLSFFKLDVNGSLVSQQPVATNALAWDVIELPDGTLTLSGVNAGDLMLMNINATGTQINWTKLRDNNSIFDNGYDLAATPDGGYIVSGRSTDASGEILWLLKTDCAGN